MRRVPIIFISITIHFGESYSLTILHLVHLKRQIIYRKKKNHVLYERIIHFVLWTD